MTDNLTKLFTRSNPTVKESVWPQKGHREKRCEIQDGGQESAVMVGLWKKF